MAKKPFHNRPQPKPIKAARDALIMARLYLQDAEVALEQDPAPSEHLGFLKARIVGAQDSADSALLLAKEIEQRTNNGHKSPSVIEELKQLEAEL